MQSLNGNQYAAAHNDDAMCKTMLYFQKAKSETFNSYKHNEAYIETQTGNCIKIICSDWGGEFLLKEFTKHQDQWGTICELPVHDSPPQNGTAEHGMQTRAEQTWVLLGKKLWSTLYGFRTEHLPEL